MYYIMFILLNPCLSILPTFSALQTTVIPWSEMFPLFCECYSLYCSLNSKKMIELSLAFGPFVITISHYLSRYIYVVIQIARKDRTLVCHLLSLTKIHVHHVWGFPAKTTDCVFQAGSKIAILHNWKTNFGGRRWTRNAVTQLQVE